MNIRSIHVIDDEPDISELITQYAATENIKTYSATSWDNVTLKELKNTDFILLDLYLPELDGLDILELLKQNKVTVPIVFCSEQDDNVVDTAPDILKAHGLIYAGKILKPFSIYDFNKLLEVLHKLDLTEDFDIHENSISTTPLEVFDKKTFKIITSLLLFSHSFTLRTISYVE